jgi:FkbM family methyltransferase
VTSSVRKIAEFVSTARELGDGPWEKGRVLWHQTHNLRVRLGITRHHPDDVFRLGTRFGALSFRSNFGDITNLTKVLHQGCYRWRQLPDDGVILDVGANIGMAAVWFAHFNPARDIWCFEPLPENVAMIRRNCPRANVVEAALGEAPGVVSLAVDPGGVIASSIPTAWESAPRTFPMRTLDDCAAEYGWGQVALLKIDAEGMEPAILRGGAGLLSRVARVAAETHGRAGHDEVLRLLQNAGLTIEDASFDERTGTVFAHRRVGTSSPGQTATAPAQEHRAAG